MGSGGGLSSSLGASLAKKRAAEEAARKQAEENAFIKLQQGLRPGQVAYRQSAQEKKAGVDPAIFEGMRDRESGELLSQYRYDPYAGEAVQKLRSEAFSEGESPWAKMQREALALEQQGAMDQAAKQGLQALSMGQANLARSGGLSSGARERMARAGARDLMMARQGVSRQGLLGRMGIQQQDLGRRQDLLQSFADAERGAQEYNLGQLRSDIDRKAMFDADRYGQQMQAYGAAQSAQAQREAARASRPKSGCCFIFLEARYGDGTMDEVVRKYRDEHMTEQNRRGYYKLTEVLVPLMRKYVLVKFLVRVLMTDPLVSYGKWHYGKNKWGWIFRPVKDFWLTLFHYLGGEHEFVRENGEVV